MTPLTLALFLGLLHTAPTDVDSDGDGLSDFHEVHKHRTDPGRADSDGDGIPDGDWRERREYTYVVRSVVEVLRPVTPETLVGDFQDARVLREAKDRVELEVLHYPFSTVAEALEGGSTGGALPDRDRWLASGPTSDHDAALRTALLDGLAGAGIDTRDLEDPETIERVALWLLRHAEYSDGFTTFVTAFDADGAPYVPDELIPHVGDGNGVDADDWAGEISARGMFAAGRRGSCTSSAIYLSGCLRAVGIPTRTVLGIPIIDAGDEREWAMVRDRIRQPQVRASILGGLRGMENAWASHTFNEVFLRGRWWRLDYDELGVGILRRERFGLLTHVATFADWADADAAATIGRRQSLGLRDSVLDGANPYSTLTLSEELGEHCTLDLPEAQPLVGTVAALTWTDSPELPPEIRASIERRLGFGLIARIAGLENAAQFTDLLELADLRVRLVSGDLPGLGMSLDPGCWWWRKDANVADVYLPFGPADRRDLAAGPTYRVLLGDDGDLARLEPAEGLVVVRQDAVPEHVRPKDPRPQRAGSAGIAGTVVDASGQPVRARVAAVWPQGSISTSSGDDGSFRIARAPASDEYALHASTEDARIAVLGGVDGADEIRLVLAAGGTLDVSLDGLESARCAVIHDGLRIEDFTLRTARPARVVVPGGSLTLRVYSGDDVHAEQTVDVAIGETRAVRLSVP